MKYNIWHDGERDINGALLWWVEVEEQGGNLPVLLDVPLLMAEKYVAGVVADDDVVCYHDYESGKSACSNGRAFRDCFEVTQRWIEAAWMLNHPIK